MFSKEYYFYKHVIVSYCHASRILRFTIIACKAIHIPSSNIMQITYSLPSGKVDLSFKTSYISPLLVNYKLSNIRGFIKWTQFSRDVFALSSIMCIRILFFICLDVTIMYERARFISNSKCFNRENKNGGFCWSECDARLFCLVSTSHAELHPSCLMNNEKNKKNIAIILVLGERIVFHSALTEAVTKISECFFYFSCIYILSKESFMNESL